MGVKWRRDNREILKLCWRFNPSLNYISGRNFCSFILEILLPLNSQRSIESVK
jgi:hypothetical protein